MDWVKEYEEETGFSAYEFDGAPKRGYVEWLEEELDLKAKAGQLETVVTGMTGEVVKMGTMLVDDEQLTGVFVICDPDEFTKQTTNILYRNVKIVPFDECQ